jgi:Replication-relaxation
MRFRLREKDCHMLRTVAEYRLLTATQSAALFQTSKKTMWKRLHDFEVEGMVTSKKYGFGRGQGRPELIFSLTENGVDTLKEKGVITPEILFEKVSAENIHCIDHQLMLNWFRVHLNHAVRNLPRISGTFLSHNSPFISHDSKGQSVITDYAPVEGSEDKIKFIPDAAFALHDTVQDMTCMFFLEVDCGTETVVSPKRDPSDVRQKIINYQSYILSEKYKRYEKIWNADLVGFRMLLLTNSAARLKALCRLVQEMHPHNFILLTELSHVFSKGVSSHIWVKGGKFNDKPCSIFCSLSCEMLLSETTSFYQSI